MARTFYTAEPYVEEQAGAWKKPVLRAGAWLDPKTGELVKITPEVLRDAVEGSNAWLKNGNAITFPDGHTTSSKANMGYWKGFSIENGWAVGSLSDVADDVKQKIGKTMRGVSVKLRVASQDEPIVDSAGNTYKALFEHVAATELPVVTGQQNFEKVFSFHSENTMDLTLKRVLELLDLTETASEQDVQLAMDNMRKKGKGKGKGPPDPEHMHEEMSQLKAENERLEADLAALKAKQPQALDLSQLPPIVAAEFHKARKSRVKNSLRMIEMAQAEGKLDPALATFLSGFATVENVKALSLSQAGEVVEKEQDFGAALETFLAGRKRANIMLEMTSSTNTGNGSGPEDKYADELVQKIVSERANMANGKR